MHEERPKFDTLFAEARHFRGDCRLVRTAIRRGWVRPEDRDALLARYRESSPLGEGTLCPLRMARARLSWVWIALEMQNDNIRAAMAADGRAPRRSRPRTRPHAGDFATRLDADALPPATWSVDVTYTSAEPPRAERVRVVRDGSRLWLVCPRCGTRRRHLYPLASGVACRRCGRVRG